MQIRSVLGAEAECEQHGLWNGQPDVVGSYDFEARDCERLSGREGWDLIWESRKNDQLL